MRPESDSARCPQARHANVLPSVGCEWRIIMSKPDKRASEPREIELKLEFDPADRDGIEAHPRLAAALPEKQTLISVYYDTNDHALQKAHVALRVRKRGDRYIQAIKGMDGAGSPFE